jgi:molybdate transport system substrate-binding protein
VPANLYGPIRQDAVRTEADNEAAKAFLAFLKSTDPAAVIERLGYGTK